MREGLEAVFTVVGTMSRIADTAEGGVVDSEVEHGLQIARVSQTFFRLGL